MMVFQVNTFGNWIWEKIRCGYDMGAETETRLKMKCFDMSGWERGTPWRREEAWICLSLGREVAHDSKRAMHFFMM